MKKIILLMLTQMAFSPLLTQTNYGTSAGTKSGFVFSGVGSPKNENYPYVIRYGELVVPLVKAMPELIADVDQLKEQLKQYTRQSTTPDGSAGDARLMQNNPDPFSTDTAITMELPEATRRAAIVVYNLEGKQLKKIAVGERGKATFKISGNELSAPTPTLRTSTPQHLIIL